MRSCAAAAAAADGDVACCRVGRTGRAGNKGTAITFISAEEEQYAPDLVKALKDSGSPVPDDLMVRGGACAAGSSGSEGAISSTLQAWQRRLYDISYKI